VRYDTPEEQPVQVSLSWGDGGVSAAALRFKSQISGFKTEGGAAIAHYVGADRSPCADTEPRGGCTTIGGSISVMHLASKISLSAAAGAIIDGPDGLGIRDGHWHYAKLSRAWSLNSLGDTALYAEYFRGVRGAELAFEADPDSSARFTARTSVAGLGLMQNIDAAEMQLYVAWRRYDIDVSAASGPGGSMEDLGLEGFSAFLAGSRISF
jgi:hypothetical protein